MANVIIILCLSDASLAKTHEFVESCKDTTYILWSEVAGINMALLTETVASF